MRALVLCQGKKVSIYTDSKYAFMVVHACGEGNKDVKHAEEILQLLDAVNLLNKVAVMHCPGHQRDNSQMSQGNQTADEAVRQTAGGLPCLDLSKFIPQYIEQNKEWDHEWGFTNTDPISV